jgi:predicted lipoprotein with Yx(FWY)xxD motif
MKRYRRMPSRVGKVPTLALLLLGTASVALVVAGCGGGGDSSANSSTTAKTSAAGTSAKLSVAKTDLGRILVGGNGRSLYLFEKDKGPMSTCNGACASSWPPLTSDGKPQAGSGVDAAKLSTSKRSDGAQQVVYAGHPLYYYAGDSAAGDTNGEGLDQFGAEWYVVSSSGNKVEDEGS